MKVPPELASATVRDGDQIVRLGDLWRTRGALLLWVRHFG